MTIWGMILDTAKGCLVNVVLLTYSEVAFPKASFANVGQKFHWTGLLTMELGILTPGS